MRFEDTARGTLFALTAAAINGTIGVLSKTLFAHGLTPAWIAFLKTLIGLIALSALLARMSWRRHALPARRRVREHAGTALAACFGILFLFAFETRAYGSMPAANVVLLLMATSAITANLAARRLLGRPPSHRQWAGTVLTIIGIALMLGIDLLQGAGSPEGIVQSCLAGFGYGLFTVLLKRFRLVGGLALTRQLLLWGSLYLLLPALGGPLDPHVLAVPAVASSLLALATLPSILGFFCTTRAVDLLPPEKVQLLELSEPVFAALMALLFLGEVITAMTVVGGLVCAAGICVGTKSPRDD